MKCNRQTYNITYQLFTEYAKHDPRLTGYGGIVWIYKAKYGKKLNQLYRQIPWYFDKVTYLISLLYCMSSFCVSCCFKAILVSYGCKLENSYHSPNEVCWFFDKISKYLSIFSHTTLSEPLNYSNLLCNHILQGESHFFTYAVNSWYVILYVCQLHFIQHFG